jgi:hypothetical protein
VEVTIVRGVPGGTDQYGDRVEGTEERIPVPGAIVAPRRVGAGTASIETADYGRQGVVVGMTLYLPPGTDLKRTDDVEIDGERFTVEGESGEWASPYTGRRHGMEVAVRRAEG